MVRANLGALLGNLDDAAVAPELAAAPEALPEKPVQASPPESRESSTLVPPRPAPKLRTAAPPTGAAAYLGFVRKETRLREDQQNRLTLEARRLNRAKTTGAARITDNTLIRVAVDLLLERIGDAHGDDEPSILESLNS